MADTPTGAGSNGGTTTVVANPPNPPTTNTVPNTTTDTKTVQYQSAATEHVFDPRQDVAESVFNPGTTYNGPATQESVFDPRQDPEEHVFNPNAALPNPAVTAAAQINDPLAGLTPKQLQDLGGADPTDPYIRARLGIPQLPGSTLNVTSGFGFGNLTTNLPSIDNALGTIKSLFSGTLGGGTGGGSGLSSLFTNFSATVGGLFGGKPTATATAATTGSGTAALVAPPEPDVKQAAVNPASDPSQFPAYDDNGNLQPGFKINEETGQTYYAGVGPATTLAKVDATTTEGFGVQAPVDPTTLEGFGVQATVDPTTLEGYGVSAPVVTRGISVSSTTLDAEQSDAFYNGTGTPTTAQVLAQDQQLAADAAKLYPGTKNKALLNIDKSYAAIEENTAGIANAEKIVAANNTELADPNISDARRAELLANNQAQQEYIQVATENSAIQQNVIEQNANVYAAGGGNEGDGQSPNQVSALVDPTANAAESVFNPGIGPGEEQVFNPDGVDPNSDPFEQSRYEAQLAADAEGPTEANLNVDPLTDDELAVQEAFQQDQRNQLATENFIEQPPDVDPADGGLELPPGAEPDGPPQAEPYALNPDEEPSAAAIEAANQADQFYNGTAAGAAADQAQGSQQAAIVAKAKQQATIQARYKQPGNTDWRVRLSLGPGAQYLYNATPAGVLAPLKANGGTDGVIFPYTPSITTTYSANYEQYDLIHSNYRGLFYKNSRVGDIQLRGTFTAQDTTEANYLLAVIHFFRSVTKMFYGQDAERGTPPPICLLNGFGGYQFSDHPVVVSSFNYTLPNDVDYIRTTNPNNFGLNLNNRYNPSGASLPAGGALAGVYRLLNAIPNGLPKGALPKTPAPNTVAGSVTNNVPASYVPTKMEIDVTLIPVQSRSQVSQQFSLKGFANGDLLKGGFW